MRKPVTPAAVRARDYAAQRLEALGQPTHLDFEADDGTIIRMPHPLCLDDAALTRYEPVRTGEGLDREALFDDDGKPMFDPATRKPLTRIVTPNRIGGELAPPYAIRVMRAVLGDDNYGKLSDSGLHGLLLNAAFESMVDTADSRGSD